MFHVILARSRSGGRAIDRMEAQRRVQKACDATSASVTKVEDARRFIVAASDGLTVEIYDPPMDRSRVKQSWSALDATFKTASVPIAKFLLALSSQMNCVAANSWDPDAPELPLQFPRSTDPVPAEDLVAFIEEFCATTKQPDRPPRTPASRP